MATSNQSSAFIGKREDCITNQICFVPGDFINFTTTQDGTLNWKRSFTFSTPAPPTSFYVDKYEYNYGGFFVIDGKMTHEMTSHEKEDYDWTFGGMSEMGFAEVYPSPVNVDTWLKNSPSAPDWKGKVKEGIYKWNEFERQAIFINESMNKQTIIDKETGILLFVKYHMFMDYEEVLSDTNIIKSSNTKQNSIPDSSQISSQTMPQTTQPILVLKQIPSWIKHNAKWWADGQIDDSAYFTGMKYLIKKHIIVLPQKSPYPDSNQQEIPQEIRNAAKSWALGNMYDSNFILSLQWLISNHNIIILDSNIIQTKTSDQAETLVDNQGYINIVCKSINDILPDPKCTPGAIDPRVTQDNIDSTICVPGYTKTVRPPVSYTEPLKYKEMAAYGYTDSAGNYEFDHLIPLEIGGAPSDVKNLWPEPHSNSFEKDKFENYLHKQVCSGEMDLKTAQDEMDSDWFKNWDEAGRP